MKKKLLVLLLVIATIVAVIAIASCGGGKETYTVTFDTSLSREGKGAVPSQTVVAGGKVTEPDIVLTKPNCEFIGWYNGKVEWDFENDVVTSNITLKATFKGIAIQCDHDYQVIESKAPTCKADGYYVEQCTICKLKNRVTKTQDASLEKLQHVEQVERVEPTCGVAGYNRVYCENGCGLNDVRELEPTGKHIYETDDDGKFIWTVTQVETKYTNGLRERVCKNCGGAKVTDTISYSASQLEMNQLSITNFKYTGGKYDNVPFVNVASYARVTVSSYYTIAMGHLINDGDLTKYWSADTYADGSDYTKDYFEIEWDQAYDFGALRIILPYYTGYNLGADCYVSYNLYYWDTEANDYVFYGEISDKDATKSGINGELMLTFAEPINTTKFKFNVTHAGRYTPAMIYELEAYAKTAETERIPTSALGGAAVTISGKYNEWVAGGDALVDNLTASYWYTDARYNPNPWVTYEWASETFVASVQWSTPAHAKREFLLEMWIQTGATPEEGRWQQIGSTYAVPSDKKGANENPNIIKYGYDDGAKRDICVFNVDIEFKTTKIRLSITNEPVYWESYVYDLIPTTVTEKAFGELPTMQCTHRYPVADKVEYVDEYGNQMSKDKVIDPTCTEAGYKLMKCGCGHYMTTLATDSLGHSFGEYTVKTEATATTLGVKHASCVDCQATREYNYTYGTTDIKDVVSITDYYHNAAGAWAQSFDDGNYKETYEWAVPQLLKYNFRATTVMSITYGEGYVKEWTEWFSTGAFDLGSHSYNHSSIYASSPVFASLLKEVVDAQYWFRATFPGQQVLVFAAPLGATGDKVADYLCGPMAANRNGGQTTVYLNLIDHLEDRKTAGNVNTWVSKSDQNEGVFVLVEKDKADYTYRQVQAKDPETEEYLYDEEGNPVYVYEYVKGGYTSNTNGGYSFSEKGGDYALLPTLNGGYAYARKNVNLVYSAEDGTYVSLGLGGGSYYYDAENWQYTHKGTGGYTANGDGTFTYSANGNLLLVKTEMGSYEKWIDKIVENNAWTVDCLHSLGSGSIYSSYASTISKFDYMKLKNVWGCSYNEIVQYRKEYSAAVLNIVEYSDAKIEISLTDDLDDYMFDQALTLKVKLPSGWSNVTVMQGEKTLEKVTNAEYKDDMTAVVYTVQDGYLYIDAIPDCGNIVITK